MSQMTSFFDSISCKKRSFIVLFHYVKLNNWLHFICKPSKEQVKGKPQIKKIEGKMKKSRKKLYMLLLILAGIIIVVIVSCWQNRRLKKNTSSNDIFTEAYFDGLVQIESWTGKQKTDEVDKLRKFCAILEDLKIKEMETEKQLSKYGGYTYKLCYKGKKEKIVSIIGISDTRTIVSVDKHYYETDKAILPEVVELFR